MKKCKKNTNKNNGITLIALVLTIIVLLILAGVALSLALGQNGLISKARESQQKQEIAQEKDRIMTAYSASFTNKDGKFNKDTFKKELKKQGIVLDGEIEENGKLLKFKTKHVEYVIDDGRIQTNLIGQNQSSESGIQVGDIITYDPTKGVTEQSKLTYTSQKGTAKICGNGYGVQTVTASITKRSFDNEHYDIHADANGEYDKELVQDSKVKANKEKLKNHIFKSDWYWLCSRFVGANSNTAFFNLYAVGGRNINNSTIFSTFANSLFQDIRVSQFLRPVVYLDGSMLEKVSDREWKIKD